MAADLTDKQRRALAALLTARTGLGKPLCFVDEAVEPSINELVNDLGAARRCDSLQDAAALLLAKCVITKREE
jgi:hypothetical protein